MKKAFAATAAVLVLFFASSAAYAGTIAPPDVVLDGIRDIPAGTSFDVGNLTLNAGAAFSGSGALNVHGDLAVNADFNDAETIATTVTGATTVAAGVTYAVNGMDNRYRGGLTLEGALRHAAGGSGAIRLGSPVAMGRMDIDGGAVQTAAGGYFAINNADITVTRAGGGNTLDVAAASILDLGTSDLTIDLAAAGGTVKMTTGGGVELRGYAQLAGNASVAGGLSGGRLVVAGAAVIGGARAGTGAALDVAGDAVRFDRGLTLDRGGALTVFNNTGGVVTLGTAANAADLIMRGGNTLHAGAGNTLTLASGHAGGGRLLIGGGDSAAHGKIDAPAFAATIRAGSRLTVATGENPAGAAMGFKVASMDVAGELLLGDGARSGVVGSEGGFRIASGGRVTAVRHTAYLNGNAGNGESFVVARGGKLTADTAAIDINGFSSVNIDGVFTAGVADGGGARLRADSDVFIASGGVIALTAKLAATAKADIDAGVATRLIQTDPGQVIASHAKPGSRSMFGCFDFALNDDRTILYIEAARDRVFLGGGREDRLQAARNLRALWGGGQIDGDFAAIVYGVAKGDVVSDGSPAGDKNIAIFDAIANPDGRTVGLDTVEYVNGAHLYGVTDAAIDASRGFAADMEGRAGTVRDQFAARREHAAPDAPDTAGLNGECGNRAWFGGSGLWREAGARDGFSGYSRDGYGIVGGYDRVVAETLALGAALSYLKGGYKDSGALDSDSRIESFSAGLYGVWSGSGGVFATLHGAYASSANALRALRRDPAANRSVWSTADFTTHAWSLGGLAGYDCRLGETTTLIPAAGINYVGARNSEHESFLDGVATQSVGKTENHGIFLPVELSARHDMSLGTGGGLRLEGVLGYAYNLNGNGMTGSIRHHGIGSPGSVELHGRGNARHSYRLGAGVRYVQRNFAVDVAYDVVGGSGDGTHRVTANAGLAF